VTEKEKRIKESRIWNYDFRSVAYLTPYSCFGVLQLSELYHHNEKGERLHVVQSQARGDYLVQGIGYSKFRRKKKRKEHLVPLQDHGLMVVAESSLVTVIGASGESGESGWGGVQIDASGRKGKASLVNDLLFHSNFNLVIKPP
jgi:hypothetical protein